MAAETATATQSPASNSAVNVNGSNEDLEDLVANMEIKEPPEVVVEEEEDSVEPEPGKNDTTTKDLEAIDDVDKVDSADDVGDRDPEEEEEVTPPESPRTSEQRIAVNLDPQEEEEAGEYLVAAAAASAAGNASTSASLASIASSLSATATATPATTAGAATAASSSSTDDLLLLPSPATSSLHHQQQKSYDYLLKVLLVGDSDVGKQEILAGLDDGMTESPFCSSTGGAGKVLDKEAQIRPFNGPNPISAFKQTIILIDGKRVKLQLWDTSGQGRFCTIIRSYSRGAQGILLVYDITNKWSFEGIDRWLKEVDQVGIVGETFWNAAATHHSQTFSSSHLHSFILIPFSPSARSRHPESFGRQPPAPGVPPPGGSRRGGRVRREERDGILRGLPASQLQHFRELRRAGQDGAHAQRHGAAVEVKQRWVNDHYNCIFRLDIARHSFAVSTLYEACAHAIVNRTTVYGIDRLPLPDSVKQNLKSYAMTNNTSSLRHSVKLTIMSDLTECSINCRIFRVKRRSSTAAARP